MTTRRQFLRRGSALSALLTAATAAGCGDRSPSAADTDYTAWLPTPDRFGSPEYSIEYYDVGTIRAHEARFDRTVYDTYREWAQRGYDSVGLSLDSIETELLGGNVTNLRGEWERETLLEALESRRYQEADSYAGFDIYRRQRVDLAVAVSDRRLLLAGRTGRSPTGTAKLFVDVASGEEPRYVDRNDGIGTLLDRLGEGTTVVVKPQSGGERSDPENGQFSGAEARGVVRTIDGDTTTDKIGVVVAESGDLTPDTVRTWTESDPFFGDVRPEMDVGERSALVTVARQTADLDSVRPRL